MFSGMMKGGKLDPFGATLLAWSLWIVLWNRYSVSGEPLLFKPGAVWVNNASADGFFPMRIISSDSLVFTFGFVGTYTTGYYLSVFISGIPNVENGTVWSANRNNPVTTGATLRAEADNNVALVDTEGVVVWSTKLDAFQVTGWELRNTGNLALINATNSTVWQSFDYPTDILLFNQSLATGSRIVSRAAPSDLREGPFSMRAVEGGIVLEGLLSKKDNSSSAYWGWGLDPSNPNFAGLQTSCPYAVSVSVDLDGLRLRATHTVPAPCNTVSTKLYQRAPSFVNLGFLRLEPDGNVHVYSVDVVMTDAFVVGATLLSLFEDGGCDLPASCGFYSVCQVSGGVRNCSCSPPAEGCAPPKYLNRTDCGAKERAALGVGYQYFPSPFSQYAVTPDKLSCEEMCLPNCFCLEVFYQEEGGICLLLGYGEHILQSSPTSSNLPSSGGLDMGRMQLWWSHFPFLLVSAVMVYSVGVGV